MPMSQFETPILRKTAPNVAAGEAVRMSQASASAKPPPTHAPFTAAIHGLRDRWMRSCSVARWSCHMKPATVGRNVFGAGGDALRLQVEARAEPAPRAGDDDGTQRRVDVDRRHDTIELTDHRRS